MSIMYGHKITNRKLFSKSESAVDHDVMANREFLRVVRELYVTITSYFI